MSMTRTLAHTDVTHVSSSSSYMYPPPPHMTRTLAHTDVTHVSSSSSYMYPPPHMTRTLAHTDVSSIDMYNNDVGKRFMK